MRRAPASPWLATVPPAPTFSEARLASHRSEENPLRRTQPQCSNLPLPSPGRLPFFLLQCPTLLYSEPGARAAVAEGGFPDTNMQTVLTACAGNRRERWLPG